LSFSTKLSQYMMAGRCILAIGPEGLGSLRLVRDISAGVVLHDATAANWQAPLLGQLGRAWAETWVDRRTGHERFRRELQAAVDRHARGAAPRRLAA
jgi:hypothetical protein